MFYYCTLHAHSARTRRAGGWAVVWVLGRVGGTALSLLSFPWAALVRWAAQWAPVQVEGTALLSSSCRWAGWALRSVSGS